MNRPHSPAQQLPEPTIQLAEGWHCLHAYYQIDRAEIAALSSEEISAGAAEVIAVLNSEAEHAPARIQSFAVSGHRADFGLMILDQDPLKVDSVHQRLLATKLGHALIPSDSFVSITEVSEYVPTVEQYSEKLQRTGTPKDDL